MRKVNIYMTIMKIILDFILIFGMFFIVREIRLVTDLIPNISLPIQSITQIELFPFAILWATILVIIFLMHQLYRFDESLGRVKEFSKVLLYSFYSFVFFTVIIHLWQGFIFDKEIPRLIIWYTYLFWSIVLIVERFIISFIRNILFKKWVISKSKIFIINNKSCNESRSLVKSFLESIEYTLVWVSNSTRFKIENVEKNNLEELKQIIKNREINELLYINSNYSNEDIYELWELSMIFWVKYRYMANSFDLAKTNTTMSLVNNYPALEIWNTTLSWKNMILKRIFDIVFSIFLIIIFFPVFLIVAILIKIEDPKWPIIYKNKRVWRMWEEFNLFKFRYMKWKYCTLDAYNVSEEEKKKNLEFEENLIESNSNRSWPLYKIKNDPRKTKIWTFIEKYSIDEIPQFFNVLLWNMSLIWPRPHQIREVNNYLTKHIMLLTIKPWVTWMAQVNWRDENSFEDEAKLDMYYIENWSLLLDIKILFKTIFVVLGRK